MCKVQNTEMRLEACNFIKKESLAQVFSCEFCEISKNRFFTEHLWETAFGNNKSRGGYEEIKGYDCFCNRIKKQR